MASIKVKRNMKLLLKVMGVLSPRPKRGLTAWVPNEKGS